MWFADINRLDNFMVSLVFRVFATKAQGILIYLHRDGLRRSRLKLKQ